MYAMDCLPKWLILMSLRSVNTIDCNYLARLYGGGGHLKASGFVIEGEVQEKGPVIIERLIGEVYEKEWL